MPFITPSKDNQSIIDFDYYKPVKVIFCCDSDGKITPMRFKITTPDETDETFDIDGITQTKDVPHGVSFRCGISCYDRKQFVTLVYYYDDHVWVTPK